MTTQTTPNTSPNTLSALAGSLFKLLMANLKWEMARPLVTGALRLLWRVLVRPALLLVVSVVGVVAGGAVLVTLGKHALKAIRQAQAAQAAQATTTDTPAA